LFARRFGASNGNAERRSEKQSRFLREDLFAVLDVMGESAKDVRDRALLLIGFAGAFRRSELVGLDRNDVEHVR
jgi:site-specific recombinase XerC